jgi:hypothetical protein
MGFGSFWIEYIHLLGWMHPYSRRTEPPLWTLPDFTLCMYLCIWLSFVSFIISWKSTCSIFLSLVSHSSKLLIIMVGGMGTPD